MHIKGIFTNIYGFATKNLTQIMRVFTDSTSDDNKRPHDEASKHRGHKRRRKRSYSLERNVETLVVADGKMTEFYKNENIETYILTIMNMVNW